MENNIPSVQDMSSSNIAALANVKELMETKRNYSHTIILFVMIIFVLFIVGLSVFNFGALVTRQNAQVTTYNTQLHKLGK